MNDGRELFGPRTGDGFAELAAYDDDGNDWIDENDGIYDNLSIWTRDIQGNDHLSNLAEREIGAIYLSAVDSRFDLKDGANQLHGRVSLVRIDPWGLVYSVSASIL